MRSTSVSLRGLNVTAALVPGLIEMVSRALVCWLWRAALAPPLLVEFQDIAMKEKPDSVKQNIYQRSDGTFHSFGHRTPPPGSDQSQSGLANAEAGLCHHITAVNDQNCARDET